MQINLEGFMSLPKEWQRGTPLIEQNMIASLPGRSFWKKQADFWAGAKKQQYEPEAKDNWRTRSAT